MQHTCAETGTQFEISDFEQELRARLAPVIAGKTYELPVPKCCPEVREQQRLAFRNERGLYHRKCDKTGKHIIAVYPEDTPFPVFSQEVWWGDDWDGKEYGQDYDFSHSFFEQFKELSIRVPRLPCSVSNSENCEYNNFCADSKNCYMSQRVAAEDSYYSYLVIACKSIYDCYNTSDCELCYQCIDAKKCYNLFYSQNVVNCSDSRFLFNCRDSRNCFLCTNLRGAEYYVRNQKVTKEEFDAAMEKLRSLGYADLLKLQEEFAAMKKESIVPHLWGNTVENVSGNYLSECKNSHNCYDCLHGEDMCYTWGNINGKDCLDNAFGYDCQYSYEFAAGVHSQRLWFCFNIIEGSHDLLYSIDCMNSSHDLFGCMSLKKDQYCILNKQYSREEYETLIPKIIEHMQSTGEWGEFFPIALSPFAYNETVAHEYYPITESEATTKGWKWKSTEDDVKADRVIDADALPDSISDIPEDVLNWAIRCEKTGKLFKLIRQEFDFYRTYNLPVPRLHPDERHKAHIAARNPRKLWNRTCAKCSKDIQTTYAPERPEKVYCERCYLTAVY